jgi:hypothetical protein
MKCAEQYWKSRVISSAGSRQMAIIPFCTRLIPLLRRSETQSFLAGWA